MGNVFHKRLWNVETGLGKSCTFCLTIPRLWRNCLQFSRRLLKKNPYAPTG